MVAVITGANRGIGLEFSRQLSKEDGYKIVGICRQASKDLKTLSTQTIEGVDISDPTQIEGLAKKITTSIDLLILNAGIFLNDSLGEITSMDLTNQLQVNAVGAVLCAQALVPRLKSGSKLVFITSRMGSIADNESGAYYGYRMSKAALNAAGVSMAHDLKSKGIPVALLHPGYVKTDMTQHQGHIEPAQSVQGMRKVIAQLNMQNTGKFWHVDGTFLPW